MSNYNQTSYPQGAPAGAAGGVDKMSIIAIVGAILAVISPFINWVNPNEDGTSGGIKGKEGTDAWILLAAALIAAALFVGAIALKKAQLNLGGVGLSVVALGIALWNLFDPDRLGAAWLKDQPIAKGASDSDIEKAVDGRFDAGAGIYLALVGAAVAVVCGFLAHKNSRAQR